MKYDELIKILKEEVTDDMFEALVMNDVFCSRLCGIVSCETNFDNLKIYTLHEQSIGKEIYLVINPSCKNLDKNLFPDDKYMIANKDEDTLFYLANQLNGRPHKNFPVNLCWLIPILEDFEEDRQTAEKYIRYRFTDKIEKDVRQEYKVLGRKQEKLFDKAIDCAVSRLIEEKYLLSEKNWNKKTGRIKLTGEKGENRTCRCNFVPLCYVDFSVKKQHKIFNMIFNNEKDIPKFVENVMKVIKDK